ncbi:MAG: alpha/beta fold hydrolase [Candidatus Baltobacteraceae bacterium]
MQPANSPARSYAEAVERVRELMARDDESILPQARTALFEHGERRPLCVVLFHGFTNNPAQYAQLAPLIHARGVNVFVPRLPEHGDRNRMTKSIAKLTAETLLASAGDAVDIACGLGERVAVLGISLGGSLAAYFGQFREIALAVPVAPEYALLRLPYGVSHAIACAMLWLPNFFMWWDPRIREAQRPLTAYPRFSTHALMQTLRIGDDVYRAAPRSAPLAQRIVTVVNRADPAVNNEASQRVSSGWAQHGADGIEYVELTDLPKNHDIIDPDNPLARTDLVYPKLLDALGV